MLVVRLARRRYGPRDGPWIRRRDVARIRGPVVFGEPARIEDAGGRIVGWGLADPDAPVAVRTIAWGPEPPAEDWLERRIAAALARRAALGLGPDGETTGYREINSEGDDLPGLTVDRYGNDRVLVLGTAPMAALAPRVAAALEAAAPARLSWVRRTQTAQAVPVDVGPAEPPSELRWREGPVHLVVPAAALQKTGAYLDQRENRRAVAGWLGGPGRRMLDVGTHVGGFAVAGALAGARVVALDASSAALEAAAANAARNGVADAIAWVQGDMFAPFEAPELDGPFDLAVADPPKVAAGPGEVRRAVRALARLAANLAERLAPHGRLVLCSCSRNVTVEHLDAAVSECGRRLRRLEVRGPAPCHPVAPFHDGGTYLRVAVYQA